MSNLSENWEPSGNLELEKEALNAVKDTKNSLVVAGPGAGKTELLAQKASFLLETGNCINPNKILAISFKRDAAVNLKARVDYRLQGRLRKNFLSQTFDSFAKNILDRFLYALPVEFRPDPNYKVALNDNDIVRAFAKCGKYLSNRDIKKEAISNLTNNRIELLSGTYKKVWSLLLHGDKGIEPTLNFPMISLLVIHLLDNNPLILKSLRKTYSHVFLDEFQDTTHIQYALLKKCFHTTSTSLTAVGDNRQRIMLWAGAKEDIFDIYTEEFKANKYILSMNHRSAPRLLQIQKIVNDYLQTTSFSPMANSKWNENDGIAELWYFKSSITEAEYISDKILHLNRIENIPYRDMCIVVKQKAEQFSNELTQGLVSSGIHARNEAKFQDLLKEDIVLIIIDTLKSALNVRDSDAWSRIWEAKLFFEGKTYEVENMVIDRLKREFKKALKDIKENLKLTENREDLVIIMNDIVDFYNIDKIKNHYPQYLQSQYIYKLLEDLTDHLFSYYQLKLEWNAAIISLEGYDSIPVMTIHKSKGLEFDVVFFLGFDDNSFWTFSHQEDEDKCTFFVGLSRSKKYLFFVFSEERFGEKRCNEKISVLYQMLKESGVVDEKYIGYD